MPFYRIHRIKEQAREQFRWAPHVSAQAVVKAKDYQSAEQAETSAGGESWMEAPDPYSLWLRLRSSHAPLNPGDLLENESGELRICKYVGFEPAKWWVPESPPETPAGSEAH